MRLFTAIDLPHDVLGNVEAMLDRLKPAAPIKWSPPANLHITTKFIGEWPEDRLPDLKQALAGVPARAPIPIHIRHVGFYPNPRSPRVVYAGIEAPPELAALASDIDEGLAAIGVAREHRRFSPHLTLARIKEPVPMQKLLQAIASLRSLDFGAFVADRFYLYQSRMRSSGSEYTRLSEFPLTRL